MQPGWCLPVAEKTRVPFEEAGDRDEEGYREHSTIGLMITTDGSVCEIERDEYVDAEERVVDELKSMGKPFIMLLNSTRPASEKTVKLGKELESKYSVPYFPLTAHK